MSDPVQGDDKDAGKLSKRIRVSQACEPCRSRKSKCDGRQPACSVCENLRIDCSYDPNPKKRGLRPGQVSTLERGAVLTELVVAFLMARIPDGEESIRSFFCTTDPNIPFLLPGSKRNELEEKLGRWRRGPASRWLHKTAARTDSALDQLSRFRPQGPASCGSNSSSSSSSVEPDIPAISDQNNRLPKTAICEAAAKDGLKDSPVQTWPLPTNTSQYLEIYFSYTHIWLPFIDKYKLTAFTRSSAADSAALSDSKSSKSATLSLSWAVIAYASLHLPEIYRENDHTSKQNPVVAARIAQSLIPAYDVRMEQEHVQALVLLALFYFECGNHDASWIIIGIAGRGTVDLSSITPSQHLSSTTRRTALACFVVEGIIAACLGRKSQLPVLHNRAFVGKKSRSSAIYELEEEGWEEWSSWEIIGRDPSSRSFPADQEPFRILSTFNKLVHLIETLNKLTFLLSIDIETPTASATQDILSRLPDLMHRIGEIYRFLELQNAEMKTNIHILNLSSLYWMTRCVLHWYQTNDENEKQNYEKASIELASATRKVAEQYRSIYPFNSAPLAVIASLTVANRLLKESPLRHSLANHLAEMREYWGKISIEASDSSIQTMRKRLNYDGLSSEQSLKRPKQDMFQTHLAVLSGNQLSVDNQPYIHAPQIDSDMEQNPFEELGLNVAQVDPSDDMSSSALDLTALDAAVWNDDLFTKNLGYLDDPEPLLDPDLGHVLENSSNS